MRPAPTSRPDAVFLKDPHVIVALRQLVQTADKVKKMGGEPTDPAIQARLAVLGDRLKRLGYKNPSESRPKVNFDPYHDQEGKFDTGPSGGGSSETKSSESVLGRTAKFIGRGIWGTATLPPKVLVGVGLTMVEGFFHGLSGAAAGAASGALIGLPGGAPGALTGALSGAGLGYAVGTAVGGAKAIKDTFKWIANGYRHWS